MTTKINWVDEILATHNVENEPLLEEQLELFKKDIIKEQEHKQLKCSDIFEQKYEEMLKKRLRNKTKNMIQNGSRNLNKKEETQ